MHNCHSSFLHALPFNPNLLIKLKNQYHLPSKKTFSRSTITSGFNQERDSKIHLWSKPQAIKSLGFKLTIKK